MVQNPDKIWAAYSGGDIRDEAKARHLIGHIAELESRLAHPQHWTDGENIHYAEKLRQLRFELRRRQSLGDLNPLEAQSTRPRTGGPDLRRNDRGIPLGDPRA